MWELTPELEPELEPMLPQKSPQHVLPAKGAPMKDKPHLWSWSWAQVKTKMKDLVEVVDSSIDGECAMGGIGVGISTCGCI